MIQFKASKGANSSALSEPTLAAAWQRLVSRPECGFLRITERESDWRALDVRLKACKSVDKVIVIGIGGSSLGTQVIEEAFRLRSKAEVFFLEAADPYKWSILNSQWEKWKHSHIVIVSKSGGTLETLSWMERLTAHDPGCLSADRCTVVASPGDGLLQSWAKHNGIPCLWIPVDVGGRFSVLTAAGMFPAGLMGLDLTKFREGAAFALSQPGLAISIADQVLASWRREEWVTQLWTYSESLKTFGQWWQQLWSESLGKKLDRLGKAAPRASTPMACLGPRDQHSLVQQLVEAFPDKYTIVMRVNKAEMEDEIFVPSLFPKMPYFSKSMSLGQVLGIEAEAFELSLREIGAEFGTLTVPQVDEYGLGSLFMLWQMVIALLGEHMNINAFDQPGVELGKKYARQLLGR